jgi:hypothetical protein
MSMGKGGCNIEMGLEVRWDVAVWLRTRTGGELL